MQKSIQTEPTAEPVTLQEAKAHLVVEHTEDDYLISLMIVSARKHIEQRCGRVIVRQKWRLFFDYSMHSFELWPPMAQEVEQIQYLDGDGATQTLSSSVYTVDIPRQQVYLAYGQSWVSTRFVRNAIWADVWSGYYKLSSPIDQLVDIPQDIKNAILILIAEMYEHRTVNVIGQTVAGLGTFDALVQPHIVYAAR